MLVFTTNGRLNIVFNVDSISTTQSTGYESKIYTAKLEYNADQTPEELMKINYPEMKEQLKCLESMLNVNKKK